MKVILEFREDEEELARCAMNGWLYKDAIDQMLNYFRGRLKYEDLPDAIYNEIEKAREKLIEFTTGLE